MFEGDPEDEEARVGIGGVRFRPFKPAQVSWVLFETGKPVRRLEKPVKDRLRNVLRKARR